MYDLGAAHELTYFLDFTELFSEQQRNTAGVYSPLTQPNALRTRLEPASTPPRTTRAARHSPVTTPTATAPLRNPTFYPHEQHGDARDNGGAGKEKEGLEPPWHPHSHVHSVVL